MLKITLAGPFSDGKEYEAILDTGFTGFLSIPLVQAIALGLVLHGTTAISLADASTSYRLTARGIVKVGDESKVGVAILEPNSNELLLGMGFLRLFKKALYVSENAVILTGEEELEEEVRKSSDAPTPTPVPPTDAPPAPTQN